MRGAGLPTVRVGCRTPDPIRLRCGGLFAVSLEELRSTSEGVLPGLIRMTKRSGSVVRWAWSLIRLDFVGIVFGALFFCLSLTPSLMPQGWFARRVIGGLNAAIGYGIGVVIGRLLRALALDHRQWWPPGPSSVRLKATAVVASISGSLLMVIPRRHGEQLCG